MSAYTHDCPPIDTCGPCGTLPPGFVRLRYFFGKRMGVADFVDEQRYHAGKHRFHNQRLHGAGVLCGLAVRRQTTTDGVLRVGRGAALDSCGREVLVGHEQCIDLEAWYARVAAERRRTVPTWPLPALDAAGRLRLVVALRYAECGSGPEPAPRDACECDAAGCDFGRVREEFELQLFTADSPEVQGTTPLTPGRDMLERVVGRVTGPSTLHRGLADAAGVSCPDPDADGWLVLADLSFGFSTPPSATEVGVIDLATIAVSARTTLLAETALLQELLLRALGAQLEAGMLNSGPEITALGIVAGVPTTHRLTLTLSGEVVVRTLPVNAFTLTRFDPAAVAPSPHWTSQAVTTDYTAGTATSPPLIRVTLPSAFLTVGASYRLALDPAAVPPSAPIVDATLRPLRPLRPAMQFTLAEPTPGTYELHPAPYAV